MQAASACINCFNLAQKPESKPKTCILNVWGAREADEELEVDRDRSCGRVRRRRPFGASPAGTPLPPSQAALAASEALGAGRSYAAMLLPADPSCAHLLCAHEAARVTCNPM